MIGGEIVTEFQGLIDDEIDSVIAYQILNNAKNKVEDRRNWMMLKDRDFSQSASASPMNLPATWRRTLKMYVGRTRYYPLGFEKLHIISEYQRRFVLDVANRQFILSNPEAGLVHHYFLKTTPDIDEDSSPVWPERFHQILPFEMAEIYFAIDQGDRVRSWDDKWSLQRTLITNAMIDWDAKMATDEANAAEPEGTEIDDFPLGMM